MITGFLHQRSLYLWILQALLTYYNTSILQKLRLFTVKHCFDWHVSCSNLTVFLESFSLLWIFVISHVLDCIFFLCITAVLNISVPPAWHCYVTCSSFACTNVQQRKIDTSQHDTKLKFRGKWWIFPFNKILNNLQLICSLCCMKILSAVVMGPGFPSLRIVKPANIFHMWHILYPAIMLCLILLVTCSVICSFFYGIYDYTAVQILLNHDRTILWLVTIMEKPEPLNQK